jgi:hypothetical protein
MQNGSAPVQGDRVVVCEYGGGWDGFVGEVYTVLSSGMCLVAFSHEDFREPLKAGFFPEHLKAAS